MAGWICGSWMQKEKVLKTYSPQRFVKNGGFNMVYKVVKKVTFFEQSSRNHGKVGRQKNGFQFPFGGHVHDVMPRQSLVCYSRRFVGACHLMLVTWKQDFNITFHLASTSLFLKKTLGSFLLQIRYILQSLGGFPFSHSCQGRNEHVYFTTVGVVCA